MKVGRNDPCPCGSGKKFKKCCIDKPEYHTHTHSHAHAHTVTEFQSLAEAMEHGLQHLEAGEDEKAARIWLAGWDSLVRYAEKEGLRSLERVDSRHRNTLPEFVSNWVQDLESCLGNLAMGDEQWGHARLKMIRELLQQFPNSDLELIFNMQEAAAETQFLLGHRDEGDALFAALVDAHPDNAWAYIGWGDMYSPAFYRGRWQKDVNRAREIYESGLRTATPRDVIEDRIRLLEDANTGK
ncbi:SEC-C metal-binding domain-containing protein [Alicyclobacillus mengziensis]|uniref:SEC-C domain-containing protein n=1 Tax=Alicyclobacillus mengziensis TaxID=2931921 RepID=A0A9X7Z7B1_9BACL|nr:SEC-C metal-binding domain-containing protein [Alicyclobacillus mengziensis]QSO47150.1 SEC-C domain-containing protein [Alicyclobacillus mengziensis]